MKIHTREKRKWGLSTHRRWLRYFHPVPKVNRSKTFRTTDGAERWASEQGLRDDEYVLTAAKRGKRFKVVMFNRK